MSAAAKMTPASVGPPKKEETTGLYFLSFFKKMT